MILVQNKVEIHTISLQKPYKLKTSNFTILLQNVVTKEIHNLNVSTSSINSLYLKFEDLDFSNFDEGEYYLLLISNPNHSPLEVSYNNINDFKKEDNVIYFLLNNGDYIMNGDLYIGYSTNSEEVKKIMTDILRIGTHENLKTTYNKEQKYIQYNG